LADLLNAANRHYSDGYIAEYFDATTVEPKASSSGDTLVEFIVREVGDTFEAESSREDQVGSAVRALECAKEELQSAINGLKEL
jgi:hypothetical protein